MPAPPNASSPSFPVSRDLVAVSSWDRVIAFAILVMIALSPIPFASNRPFFWALWATILSVLLLLHLLSADRGGQRRFPTFLRWPAAIWAMFLTWSILQMVPLGWTVPSAQFVTPSGISPSLSIAPAATWFSFMKIFSYGVFLYLCVLTIGNLKSKSMNLFIFYTISIYALYGISALYVFGDTILLFEKWSYKGFATGTFVNRNSFALYLGFGLVLGVGLFIESVMRYRRGAVNEAPEAFLYLMLSLLLVAALLATQSRLGAFAALIGVIVVLGCAMMKHKLPRRWLALFALGLFALLVVSVWLYGAGTLQRFGMVEDAARLRGGLYSQIIDMISQRPWIGYGGGTFEYAFPLHHDRSFASDVIWDKAHSTYLTLFSEYGLPAGLAMVAIFGMLSVRIVTNIILSDRRWLAPTVALGVLFVAVIHSVADFGLEIQANMFTLLAIVAVGLAGERRHRSVTSARQV